MPAVTRWTRWSLSLAGASLLALGLLWAVAQAPDAGFGLTSLFFASALVWLGGSLAACVLASRAFVAWRRLGSPAGARPWVFASLAASLPALAAVLWVLWQFADWLGLPVD